MPEEIDPPRPPRRPPNRPEPGRRINSYEDARFRDEFDEAFATDLSPQNIKQRCDLSLLTQLHWVSERMNSIAEEELNAHVLNFDLIESENPAQRLMLGYRLAACEKSFIQLTRDRLETLRVLNTFSARIDKWAQTNKPKRTESPAKDNSNS